MIYADKREPIQIVERLKAAGVQVRIRTLYICDYVLGELCIERKSVNDFYRSIIDGRLFNQLKRIKEVYDRYILIIEGNLSEYLANISNPEAYLGALVTVYLIYNAGILYSRNWIDTVKILKFLWNKMRGSESRIKIRYKPKQMTIKERLIFILEGFPGVGEKLAVNILNHYRTLRNFANTTLAELSSIEGIGEKKAREIYDLLNTNFRRLK